jgi:glycosyltransferase involved in cell wall biosynthesis
MRVLHFLPVYAPAWQFGGPVLSVSRLCEGLAAAGVEVRVLTTDAGLPQESLPSTGDICWRNGVEVIRHPVDRQGGIIRSRALEENLEGALEGVDLLHLSAIWQPLGLPVQRAALKRGIPVLHALRGALGPYSFRRGWWKKVPWYLLRERPLLQRAAGLHLTSHQELRELRGRGLSPRRWILPNPLDLGALGVDPALRRQARQALGLGTADPLLLVCGRLHHKKGLDLLPQALAPLADRPWRLLIAGADDDGSGRMLEAALEREGLAERVLWQPTRDANDLAGTYNAADLLLLPSRHENFGNVVIEALACGAAVMVSDRTGVGDDLLAEAPPGCGWVLPREPGRWRDALSTWLDQPRRAGAGGEAWAAARYGQAAVAQQALGIYEEILHTWPKPRHRP